MSKLDSQSYAMYTDHILPSTPAILTYSETKDVLLNLFADKNSLFRKRYDAFRVVKSYAEKYKTFVAL